jgi:hypothetical protein
MLFTPIDVNPRIDVLKPLLMAKGASVSASLSKRRPPIQLERLWLRVKRAWLELVKRINTGTSLTHGFERVTVKHRLAEAKPGETIQSTWTPSRGPTEYRVRLTLNGRTVDEAEFKVSFGR